MPRPKVIAYRKIALVGVQSFPHIARPVDVLWDVVGIEGLFGIDIHTRVGTVRIPWAQVAHTLVAPTTAETAEA